LTRIPAVPTLNAGVDEKVVARAKAGDVATTRQLPAVRASVTVAVACAGFFLIVLDTTVVNIALPSIARDLGASMSGLQWVVDGYTLLFGALVLSAGNLSDRIGASTAFAWGLALFALSSVACAQAPSLGLLIAGRACQGAAAALMLPSSLALVGQVHTEPRERARAISFWAAAGGAAVAAGPVVGGLVTDGLGWRAVFYINVPIVAAALAGLVLVPRSPRRSAPLDVPGQVTAAAALAAVTYALIEGGRVGYGEPQIIAALALFAVTAVAFVVAELRVHDPAVPLRLLANRPAAATILAGAGLYFSFYGLIFTLSLYFQDVLHDGPAHTGLLFVPMTALITAATMTTTGWRHRHGLWAPLATGLLMMGAGLVALAFIDTDTPTWQIALSTVPFGVGSGIAGPGIYVATLATLPAHQAGIASGVANANRQIAATLGVAVFGALLVGRSDLIPGMRASFIVSAVAVMLGVVLALTWVRRGGGALSGPH
jgi:DHA2 family methylenomycin A resistance protein-like MFS transporter